MSNSAGFSGGISIGSFDADDDFPTLTFSPGDSAVVSFPGQAKLRFNLSTQRLEQSINTGAWTAIATGTTAGDSLAKYIIQQPNGSLPNAQSLSVLGTGIVKNTTTTGLLSIAIANTDFPAVTATYVVTTATAAPPNAINLGLLASGVLQQTVAGAVSTLSIKQSTALSVWGRSVNSTGIPDDIQATASGQFLRRDGNNTLGFGAITTADLPPTIQLTADSAVASLAELALVPVANFTTKDRPTRFVNTVRDTFYLDKTSTLTADGMTIITALGGTGRWIRMRIADLFWATQATWQVDPINGSDDNLGDSSHPLKTLSEYHLRTWATQPTQDQTITIVGDLNANDTIQSNFLIAEHGTSFTRYPHYVGVQRVVYSGTISAYTARNGSSSQPTLLTSSGIASSWTAGDGTTSFLGLMVRRTSDGSAARVVQDMGSKQAWISQPITPGLLPVTWAPGDAITVYDVPSLGINCNPHAGISQYTDLKVTGRWILQTGTLSMFNCTGDCLIQAGTFCFNQNGLTGILTGASFLVSGGIGSIAGGYHRLDCRSGEIGFNITPTIKYMQIEGTGIITNQQTSVSQGLSDVEFNQGTDPQTSAIRIGVVGGAKASFSGYVYGVINSSTTLLTFSDSGCSAVFGHVPTVTGSTNANTISYLLAGIIDSVLALSIRQSNDTHGNSVIGPAGPTLNDNASQPVAHLGSGGTTLTNAANIGDIFTTVSGVVGRVTNNTFLNNLTISGVQESIQFVETYRDFFHLDRTTTRTFQDNIVVSGHDPGSWWVRMNIPDPSWVNQTTWQIDPINGNDENLGDTSHPLRTLSEYHRRLWGAQLSAGVDHNVTITSDLNTNDTLQGFFLTREDGVAFTGYVKYFGTPIVKFSGSLDNPNGIIVRNGSTSQPTFITCSTLSGTWSNSGTGGASLVGLVIKRTSDGSTARIVQDMGGKQAWISQPLNTNAVPVTWANGDAFTVFDVPSLGQQVTTHAGNTEFHELKVSGGRFFNQYGQCALYNCAGDIFSLGTTYSQNGLTALIAGGSFLNNGGFGSVAGGYHRIVCSAGLMRINVTATIKALQVEGNGVIACINGGSQGTSDLEFNQTGTFSNLNPAINFLGIPEGRIACSGFVYGTIGASNTLINFAGRGQRMDIAHVPTVTGGTNATKITSTQAGTTDDVSWLFTRSWDDICGNLIVGPAGITLNTNRGQGITHGATASGVLDSFPIWSDVLAFGATLSGVLPSRQIIAGSGLAGGGDLSADRTINIGTVDNTIIVNADTIQVGTITTANIANDAVDNTKIRNSIGTSVIGRSVNSTGDPADIQATASGQFLRRDANSILGFGAITTEDLPLSVTSVSGVQIIAGAGLTGGGSLTTNRTIDVVAADTTITVNPDSIKVNVITSGNIADNQINNSILRDSAGNSVIGRSVNTTGDPADIIATASGQFLKRDGNGNVIFGSITTADLPINIPGGTGVPSNRNLIAGSGLAGGGDLSADRTFNVGTVDGTIIVNPDTIQVGTIQTANIANNAVDNTKIRTSVATSVIGRSANSTGNVADIQATASGQFLREDGTNTLGFGTILTSDLPSSINSLPNINIIAGSGLVGGGKLTADRTIDVVAADGTIVVTPDNIKVGIVTNANVADASILFGKLTSFGGPMLLGREFASAGVVEALTITSPLTMPGDGSLKIATNGIDNTLIRQSAGLSVVGRSANSTGNVADITSTLVGDVLHNIGSTIAWGSINGAASIQDDSIPLGKLFTAGPLTILGNPDPVNTLEPIYMSKAQARTLLGMDVPQVMDLIFTFGGDDGTTALNAIPGSEGPGPWHWFMYPVNTFNTVTGPAYLGGSVDANLIPERVIDYPVFASFSSVQISLYCYHYGTGDFASIVTIRPTKNGLRDSSPSLSFNGTGLWTLATTSFSLGSSDRIGVVVEPNADSAGLFVKFSVHVRLIL